MSPLQHPVRSGRSGQSQEDFRRGSWKHVALSWLTGATLVGVIFVVTYSVYVTLPAPVSSIQAGNASFSEERARVHLNHLVNVIGSRPFGSLKNHIDTKAYLRSQLEAIRQRKSPAIEFNIFEDDTPGAARFRNISHVWEAMDNLVVVIPGESAETMLVSAHFDTVSLSPGARDNTAAVSALLEVLSIIATSSTHKPRYTLMMAFIQGEELALLGAAALADFWPGFKNVTLFLNLDGTPGDKSMNFRSSGGYLDHVYSYVKWPLGYAASQDIFNLRLIGSDTDWSVYTRHVPGLDFATFSKRQTYHTLKDKEISAGSIQFLGDNVLAVVRRAIFFEHAWPTFDRTPHVFYSILGLVHVVYSLATAHLIHVTVTVILASTWLYFTISDVRRYRECVAASSYPVATPTRHEHPLLSLALGTLCVVLTALGALLVPTAFSFVANLYAKMYAYTRASYAVLATVFPSLFGIAFVNWVCHHFEKKVISLELSRHRYFAGLIFFWLVISLLGCSFSDRIGSTYFLTLYSAFITAAMLLHRLFLHFGLMPATLPSSPQPRRHIAVDDEKSEAPAQSSERATSRHANKQDLDQQSPKSLNFMWLSLFVVGLPPALFIFELLEPLMELAIGSMGAIVFGPLLGMATFLNVMLLIPLTRRGAHYGTLSLVFLVLSIAFFVPITLHGRGAFNEDYPYSIMPQQVDDRIEIRPVYPYSVSLHNMALILDPSLTWNCTGNVLCSAPNSHAMQLDLISSRFEEHALHLHFSTPGAWMHNISITGVSELSKLELNGASLLYDKLLVAEQVGAGEWFRIYLKSMERTKSWVLSITVDSDKASSDWKQHVHVDIQSIWAETSVPKIAHWIDSIPPWMTLYGLGNRGLASLSKSIHPSEMTTTTHAG